MNLDINVIEYIYIDTDCVCWDNIYWKNFSSN